MPTMGLSSSHRRNRASTGRNEGTGLKAEGGGWKGGEPGGLKREGAEGTRVLDGTRAPGKPISSGGSA